MTTHHADEWLTIHGGDNREVMRTLPAGSVQCVVTSPPYWSLRDYGTASWDGGDAACDHVQTRSLKRDTNGGMLPAGEGTRGTQSSTASSTIQYRDTCGKCGAARGDRQLGLEATPEAYVAAMVDVFREVRRVLRADGTLWLVLGDSYTSGGRAERDPGQSKLHPAYVGDAYVDGLRPGTPAGLKPKDLVGIPWRVAFALQADGWYLRSDIIWAKPNPMPESVTDRPTKAHEYLFLLSKSATYHYDADAIREDSVAPGSVHVGRSGQKMDAMSGIVPKSSIVSGLYRNRRSVWTIATRPYPGAHFATFPEALVEPCILAGTSEAGACATCGAPWERVVERRDVNDRNVRITTESAEGFADGSGHAKGSSSDRARHLDGKNYIHVRGETTGFRPTCAHDGDPVPCVVMDPFAGTGTVGLVANRLSRRALLIDLNPDYLTQCLERNRQTPLGLSA